MSFGLRSFQNQGASLGTPCIRRITAYWRPSLGTFLSFSRKPSSEDWAGFLNYHLVVVIDFNIKLTRSMFDQNIFARLSKAAKHLESYLIVTTCTHYVILISARIRGESHRSYLGPIVG